ncbi:msp domain containing protein [Dermatophagoides farinae]|uniref:Msp domain containing protein n=1 Tax=Dermatophagoides farinae TaxID=6954 RepID=A0A9D4SEK2_DERFA|nr:msp domain containing protein [Dermatophagoides farinae]
MAPSSSSSQSARLVLKFDPESELPFHGPYSKPSTVTLRLRSLASDRNMAFKVKTTAPKFYSVSPTHGFIAPDADCMIQLTFNGNEQDLRISKIKHKFLVQATNGPEDIDSIAPDRFWKELNSSNQNSIIYEQKLQCLFDPLESLETSNDNNMQQQFKSFVATATDKSEGILNQLLTPLENDHNSVSSSTLANNEQQQRRFSLKTLIWAIFAAIIAIVAALPIYWNRLRSKQSPSSTEHP